jgi:hypothetical protein
MMNERIRELAEQAGISLSQKDYSYYWVESAEDIEKFAELIIKDCVDTLEFHGFEDAVPYIKWMATNKLGVEQ